MNTVMMSFNTIETNEWNASAKKQSKSSTELFLGSKKVEEHCVKMLLMTSIILSH